MAARHLILTCVSTLLSLALLVSAAPAAQAYQADIIDFEIEDGRYIGTVALSGGFTVDVSEWDPSVAGVMDVWIAASGPATATVAGGVVTGDWSIAGDGGMDGFFTSQGVVVTMANDTTYSGSGVLTGSRTKARINGTVDSTSTATVGTRVGGASASNSASDPFDEALTDVLAGCGQIVARFDQRIRTEIEQQVPGATATAQGILALYRDESFDEQTRLKLESITRRAAALDAGTDVPLADLAEALDLLREVQQLQDEIADDLDCPPGKEFFNALTLTARKLSLRALDALDALGDQALAEDDLDQAFVDKQISILLPQIVELTLATGADGAGSVAPNGALDRAAAMAEGAWHRTIETDSNIDLDTLGRLSTLAAQMSWQFESSQGVTATDIVSVLGE